MLATTVALLLLAPASPDGAGCAHTLAGTDFSGHDLAPPCGVAADTAAACCAQCGNRSGCRAWTFISPRQCCLKTSGAGRRAAPGHVSGCIGDCSAPPAPAPPRPAWVGPLPNMYSDHPCPNVGIHAVGLAQCERLCAAASSTRCTAVNWGPDPTGKTSGGCVLRACPPGESPHPDTPSVHDIHGCEYSNGLPSISV